MSTPIAASGACAALVLASAISALPAYAANSAPDWEGKVVLDHGHMDLFNVGVIGEELVLEVKEDVTGDGVYHDPEDVVLKVGANALTDIPEDYPGHPQGYMLPLAQEPDRPWPGWNTFEVKDGGYEGTDIMVTNVEGPGTIYLYSARFGGLQPLLNDDRTALPGTISVPEPGHVHAVWVFSEPGVYTFDVQARAYNNEGDEQFTGTHEYTFDIAPDAVTEPAPTPTDELAPTPTDEPTADPTEQPTETPQPDPTPTEQPTDEPSVEPSAELTTDPTESPSPTPSSSASESSDPAEPTSNPDDSDDTDPEPTQDPKPADDGKPAEDPQLAQDAKPTSTAAPTAAPKPTVTTAPAVTPTPTATDVAGATSPAADSTSAVTKPATKPTPGLAHTGQNVLAMGAGGALLLIVGASLWMAARRRPA